MYNEDDQRECIRTRHNNYVKSMTAPKFRGIEQYLSSLFEKQGLPNNLKCGSRDIYHSTLNNIDYL